MLRQDGSAGQSWVGRSAAFSAEQRGALSAGLTLLHGGDIGGVLEDTVDGDKAGALT